VISITYTCYQLRNELPRFVRISRNEADFPGSAVNRSKNGSARNAQLPDGERVLVDCGADWPGKISSTLRPQAIILTHAHYIGDGASIIRPILRRRGEVLIGHASVRDQMDWCHDEGVLHAVITHCGSQIVKTDAHTTAKRIEALGRDRGVQVTIAHDGLKLLLRKAKRT
jgi:hypothetical protein